MKKTIITLMILMSLPVLADLQGQISISGTLFDIYLDQSQNPNVLTITQNNDPNVFFTFPVHPNGHFADKLLNKVWLEGIVGTTSFNMNEYFLYDLTLYTSAYTQPMANVFVSTFFGNTIQVTHNYNQGTSQMSFIGMPQYTDNIFLANNLEGANVPTSTGDLTWMFVTKVNTIPMTMNGQLWRKSDWQTNPGGYKYSTTLTTV